MIPAPTPTRSNMCLTLGVGVARGGPQEQQRPPGALPRGYARSESTEPQPVYVDLRCLHPGDGEVEPSDAAQATDGDADRFVGVHGRPPVADHQLGRLDFSREVIGRLHHWDRDLDGAWYGVVDYVVPRVGDIRAGKPVTCGLVPAAALRPRTPQVEDTLRF